jgi:hypothetical protein
MKLLKRLFLEIMWWLRLVLEWLCIIVLSAAGLAISIWILAAIEGLIK